MPATIQDLIWWLLGILLMGLITMVTVTFRALKATSDRFINVEFPAFARSIEMQLTTLHNDFERLRSDVAMLSSTVARQGEKLEATVERLRGVETRQSAKG